MATASVRRGLRSAACCAFVVALMGGACSAEREAEGPPLQGAPTSPEYAGAQASDLPGGLERCDYSAPLPAYAANMRAIEVDPAAVDASWASMQAAGALDSFVAVYADTPEACQVWVKGGPEGHVHAGSRIVSTVVVKFADQAAASAAYGTDIFKQSQLAGRPGARVASGDGTGLGPNSVVSAVEAANPSVHRAVWQRGPFVVYFNGRNLVRADFDRAITAENDRLA